MVPWYGCVGQFVNAVFVNAVSEALAMATGPSHSVKRRTKHQETERAKQFLGVASRCSHSAQGIRRDAFAVVAKRSLSRRSEIWEGQPTLRGLDMTSKLS